MACVIGPGSVARYCILLFRVMGLVFQTDVWAFRHLRFHIFWGIDMCCVLRLLRVLNQAPGSLPLSRLWRLRVSAPDRVKLDIGTKLMEVTCALIQAMPNGAYFTIENPWDSMLWLEPQIGHGRRSQALSRYMLINVRMDTHS